MVDRARDVWIDRLMDTSRRNNLLYFRDLQAGTLDLTSAEQDAVVDLFAGAKVSLTRLLPSTLDPKAAAKLREIGRKAQSNLEEKGLQTLFLAYGMATWPIRDEGRPPEAAICLLPLAIEGKGRDTDSLKLVGSGPPQINIALLYALSEQGELAVSEDDLLEPAEDGEFIGDVVLARLRELTAGFKGFEIKPRRVIGNFSFQKLSMVRDLKENLQEFAEHDVVAALSGESSCRTSLGGHHASVDPVILDAIPARNEFIVLDADSSQQAAIYAVAAGSNGVIQGPPGCGKSQTIANIITTLIADGQRVLFVAEKRAALEAVYKRLDANGLGHLALDLHGASISQKAVMQKVAATLERIRRTGSGEDAGLLDRFEDRRRRVVEHMRVMHTPVEPSGRTPYQMQVELLDTSAVVISQTRWRGPELERLKWKDLTEAADLLKESRGTAKLLLRADPSPWNQADLPDGHAAQEAVDLSRWLSHEQLPDLRKRMQALVETTGFRPPATLSQCAEIASLACDVNAFLDSWSPDLFRETDILGDLSPAEQGGLAMLWATLTDARYKAAKKRMTVLAKKPIGDAKQMIQAARQARALSERWSTLASTGNGLPVRADSAMEARAAAERVQQSVAALGKVLPGLEGLTVPELAATADSLATDEATAYAIPAVRKREARLKELGLTGLMEEIRTREIPYEQWDALLKHAYFASCFDSVRTQDPAFGGFNGQTHNGFVREFRALDRERLQVACEKLRRVHAERAIQVMNDNPVQADLVKSEAMKRSRHLSLRKLVSQAADVLTAICPCWMSSPLNVSQLLPCDRQYFDVVVFDEASQVLPEDAICSVLRGARLVVAGDRHQLPPSAFFADGAGEEDETAPTAGFESLLDQVSAFIQPWSLDWHYRSRDERLIAFSNRYIYGDRLITFPGVGGKDCITHILVESTPRDGEEESSSAEVAEVVRLIIEHAEAQQQVPEAQRESLGVIALGIKHAQRIQSALDKALDDKEYLSEYLDTSQDNPWFFLKNLERVQGDERDVIILSVGYSKDHNGKLPYRFGPLLQQGGERRLNVAITRARRRMIVVSSFSHLDMDPARSDKRGVELLRLFLQFAASGGKNLGDKGASGVGMNAFEADIYDCLTARGVPLIPQYGASGYRLDFAAQHPTQPGQFVLAIECDGASYHSAPTARDRDRLRQQQLEAIGWRFHRIWSTDWFLHREQQIELAVEAWQEAVRACDEQNAEDAALKAEDIQTREEQPDQADPHRDPPVASQRSSETPPVKARGSLELYTDSDLDRLAAWIVSDGLLRTNDEIADEMMPYLGLHRKGSRIMQRLQAAAERAARAHERSE